MGLDGAAGGGATGPCPSRRRPERRPRARQSVEAEAEISLEEAFHGTTPAGRGRRPAPRGDDPARRRDRQPDPAQGSRRRDPARRPTSYVVDRVQPHPVFTRNGADLERELPITLGEALLGAEVPVGTLKGRVLLTIPAGTQNGTASG